MTEQKKSQIVVYPASFNPVHQGHLDIVSQALNTGFDGVLMLVCCPDEEISTERAKLIVEALGEEPRVGVEVWSGLLPDFIKEKQNIYAMNKSNATIAGVIRGLRNGNDFEYETNLRRWYEELGMTVPVLYYGATKDTAHYSSTAIRELTAYGAFNRSPDA